MHHRLLNGLEILFLVLKTCPLMSRFFGILYFMVVDNVVVVLLFYAGVRKHWQERWFVLDFASQLLTYFENKEVYSIITVCTVMDDVMMM